MILYIQSIRHLIRIVSLLVMLLPVWTVAATNINVSKKCSSDHQYDETQLIDYRKPKVQRRIAVSLAQVQRVLKSGSQAKDTGIPMTRVTGMVISAEDGDVILTGVEESGQALVKLTLDDIAIVLRAIFRSNEAPGVSIDPVIKEGIMADYQRVDYFGEITNTQFAHVVFSSDYWMKRVAAGKKIVRVRGFCSYYDFLKNNSHNSSEKSTRFWFYPKPTIYMLSKNLQAMRLEGGGVELLSEVQRQNMYDITYKAMNTNSVLGRAAKGFADNVTQRYDELSADFLDLVRLRNFFALAEVFTWLDSKPINPDHWKFLLHEYQPYPVYAQSNVDTVAGDAFLTQDGFAILRGGVSVHISLPAKPIKDIDGLLQSTADLIFRKRTKPFDLYWGY